MRMFTKSSLVAPLSVLSALIISACSSGGTVTTLDASPQVPISLPQFLLDSDDLNSDNLSPTILLSTGETVSMQKGNGNEWSGTINVTPGTTFTATVTWNEAFEGQQLPLARRVETLEVSIDGVVVTTNTTDYTTEIDNDGDGSSNFEERQNDTDPFNAPANEDSSTTDNDSVNTSDDSSGSNESADDPATAPAQTPSTDDSDTSTPDSNQSDDSSTSSDSGEPTDSSDNPSDSNDTTSSDQSDENTGSSSDSNSPANDAPSSDSDAEQSTDNSDSEAPAVVDVIIPRIATSAAPVIDGNNVTMDASYNLTGEWASAIQSDSSGAELDIENLMIDNEAEDAATDGTAFRRWGAVHDGTYLYVVVVVDDNGDRRRDSSSLSNDDSLELFLDGDNSKSSNYGSDDYHRIFPGKLAGADKQSASTGDIAGPNSSELEVTFATGPGIGPRGIRRARYEQDVYELKIDLAEAGIDADEPFGFELQVNDDDGGGDRNAKFGWKHPAGNGSDVDGTQSNPSLMGTLKLE